MSIQSEILKMFRQGATPAEIIDKFSRKSYYRYVRLAYLVKIAGIIQDLILSGAWEQTYTPQVKQVLNEVKKWRR